MEVAMRLNCIQVCGLATAEWSYEWPKIPHTHQPREYSASHKEHMIDRSGLSSGRLVGEALRTGTCSDYFPDPAIRELPAR